METYKWVGERPKNIKASQTKRGLQLDPLESSIRIAFRFETIYCAVDVDGKLITQNGPVKFVRACLLLGDKRVHVAGLRDLDAAKGTQFERPWRGMLLDRIGQEYAASIPDHPCDESEPF